MNEMGIQEITLSCFRHFPPKIRVFEYIKSRDFFFNDIMCLDIF